MSFVAPTCFVVKNKQFPLRHPTSDIDENFLSSRNSHTALPVKQERGEMFPIQ